MKAYVVVKLMRDGATARVVEVDVYSEPWQSLTVEHKRDVCYAEVLRAEGETYAEARANAIAELRAYRGTGWMADLIEAE